MVMAAGLGTRMRPLTNDRPKPLVMVAGKTLIDHSLDKLHEAGVSDIVVNIHYLPEMVTAHLAEKAMDFKITISDESEQLLETGGGLIKALPFLGEDPFFCINSDNIWTENGGIALQKLVGAWDAEHMDALLLVVPVAGAHNHQGAGDFYLSEDGRLERRGERENAPFIYTGIQMISHRLLRDPPKGAFSTNILWTRAIDEGRLYGFVHSGEWFDIGSPGAIAPTEARLAELERTVHA
ncbi:MAG: nucleotidyltransferase family protein [Sphingomonadales bacterium]|nr:nucleotidyltransferase family protein [Sphingomonadales bacterium]